MPLIGDRDLVRIDLPADGEWVEVKRKLSRGDEIKVQRAVVSSAKIGMAGAEGVIESLDAGVAIEAAEFAALDVAIIQWSFPDKVSAATIRQLDPASVEAIKQRLNEMYEPALSEEESRNLGPNGATPSWVREESPTP